MSTPLRYMSKKYTDEIEHKSLYKIYMFHCEFHLLY